MEKSFYTYQTDIGKTYFGERDGAITDVFMTDDGKPPFTATYRETPLIKEAARQFNEYLAGKRKIFTLPLAPEGTPFQLKVWGALSTIPYGETRSYQDIALAVGNPKATRAVGMANHHNPISFIIPCHRVIGKNGQLVGYGGGLDLKKRLLDLERINS